MNETSATTDNQSLPIPTWDEYFMRHVYLVASKSKDTRTKIGAVLVRDKRVISEGYNGICKGVYDHVLERYERPEKYFWFEHGERNAIFGCALHGISSKDANLYTQGIPCADCTRAVIQAGISSVIIHKQWGDKNKTKDTDTTWRRGLDRSYKMFEEAGITVRVFNLVLGVKGLSDGVIYDL
jgi:dCMP deaminase